MPGLCEHSGSTSSEADEPSLLFLMFQSVVLQNLFGEQQVRMVAANTLCFDTIHVKDVLRECGGNVDDATELLISRMASSTAEQLSTEPCVPPDDNQTCPCEVAQLHPPLLSRDELSNPPEQICSSSDVLQPCEIVTLQFRIHGHRVVLKILPRAVDAGAQQHASPCNNCPAVQSDEATRSARRTRPKQQKPQGCRSARDRKPASNKPCPCKSGRRYKHCCKSKAKTAPSGASDSPLAYAVLKQLESLDI